MLVCWLRWKVSHVSVQRIFPVVSRAGDTSDIYERRGEQHKVNQRSDNDHR